MATRRHHPTRVEQQEAEPAPEVIVEEVSPEGSSAVVASLSSQQKLILAELVRLKRYSLFTDWTSKLFDEVDHLSRPAFPPKNRLHPEL